MVVLANKNYRNLIDSSHVKGFVKRSLIGTSVSEKADCNPFLFPELKGQCNAEYDRHIGGDYRVSCQHSLANVAKMHGATFALAAAGGLPIQLCHDRFKR